MTFRSRGMVDLASLLTGLLAAASCLAAVPPAIDACALLQSAEIQRVLGGSVGPGMRMDAGVEPNGAYSSSCVWLLDAPDAAAGERLNLAGRSYVILNAMQWPPGAGKARSFLESFHEARASGVLEGELTTREVGDEALWWGDGLAVRRHDTAFGLSIRLTGSRKDAPGASEERLAAQVLRRVDARKVRR